MDGKSEPRTLPVVRVRASIHPTIATLNRTQAAWAEVIGRRKETRALRAAVASLSKEVEALRTAAAAATAATTAAATITHGPDGLFPLDEDAARAAATASPSAWAPGSAGAVDVDAFVAKPTPNKAGSGDLNAFLDVFMKEGWGEEQMALIDAAAAAAAVAPLMGPSAR